MKKIISITCCFNLILAVAVFSNDSCCILSVKVAEVMGVPTFAVSSDAAFGYVPFARPCFETYVPELKYFKQFADSGTQLFSFNTNAAACDYHHSETIWVSADVWDYSDFDAKMERVLKADPNAMVMPRINLGTPRWWLDANPAELEILDNGSTLYRQPNRNPTLPLGRPFPSIVSEKWRRDIATATQRLLAHIERKGYNNHIFGYFLAGMDTEEWYHWSCGSDQLAGYSMHMRKAFHGWLKNKYVDNATLKAAWNMPEITFDSVVVPGRQERVDSSSGTFRNPASKMNVIDFYLFYNDIIPQTIDYFAQIVKRATGNKKVVGAFYGYMYEFKGDPEFGHNALELYNRSKNLDFIFVTASYGNRQFASGGDYSRSPAYSVRLHGKLWYHDNDVCSFLAPKVLKHTGLPEDDGGLNNVRNILVVLGCTQTAEETCWMYRRAMGFSICSGAYESFQDLHGGYYDDPNLMAEVKLLNRAADLSARYDRSSNSEILIVSDEASCSYATFRSEMLDVSLADTQFRLIKIGAPADHVLINDLDRLDISRYKLVIFLNNYNVTDVQRRLIDLKLKNGGKYLMWCYAPGYFNFNKTDAQQMKSLTGLDVTLADDMQSIAPTIILTDGNTALNQKLVKTGLKTTGSSRKCCRLFYVKNNDPAMVVLGTTQSGNPVFAMKDMGTWTSIYSITPCLDAAVYRAIASQAGVHIFNDKDDALYANKSYLCIHANGAGERTIKFPWACDALNALDEKPYAVNSREFTYNFKNGETLLIRWLVKL